MKKYIRSIVLSTVLAAMTIVGGFGFCLSAQSTGDDLQETTLSCAWQLDEPNLGEFRSTDGRDAKDEVTARTEGGNIVIVAQQTACIGVYDMTGRCIANYSGISGTISIPVNAGTYIVKAIVGKNEYIFKLLAR